MNFNFICITIFLALSIIYTISFTPIECDLCQLGIDSLHGVAIADNLTESEIYSALQRICDTIPSNYSTMCNTLLKYSGETIIDQVLNGTRSEVVCSELSICNSTNIKSNDHCHYQRVNKLISSSSNFNQCSINENNKACERIGRYIDHVNRIVNNQKQDNKLKCL